MSSVRRAAELEKKSIVVACLHAKSPVIIPPPLIVAVHCANSINMQAFLYSDHLSETCIKNMNRKIKHTTEQIVVSGVHWALKTQTRQLRCCCCQLMNIKFNSFFSSLDPVAALTLQHCRPSFSFNIAETSPLAVDFKVYFLSTFSLFFHSLGPYKSAHTTDVEIDECWRLTFDGF